MSRLQGRKLIHFIKNEVEKDVEDLLDHLKKTTSIWEMAHVPITASILCFLWNTKEGELDVEEVIGKSRFDMYDQMVDFIWDRYVKKLKPGTLIPDRDEVFNALEEIAFHARVKGEILISERLVRKYSTVGHSYNVLRDAGFLLLQLEGKRYQFPHLTFQEFFVGMFLAKHLFKDGPLQEKALKFIASNKYKEVHWVTFSFMMEKATEERGNKALGEILSIVDQTPRDELGILHTFLKLCLVDAFLCNNEDIKEGSDCCLTCTDIARTGFKLFFQLIRLFEFEKVIIRHAEQFCQVAKRFPELCISILTSDRDLRHLNQITIRAVAILGRFSPVIMRSLEDMLKQRYEDSYIDRFVVIELLEYTETTASNVSEVALSFLERSLYDGDRMVLYTVAMTIASFIRRRPIQESKLWRMLIGLCSCKDFAIRWESIRQINDLSDSGTDLATTAWNLLTENPSKEEATLLDRLCTDENNIVRQEAWRFFVAFASTMQISVADVKKKISARLADARFEVWYSAIGQLTLLAETGKETAEVAWMLLLQCLDRSNWMVHPKAMNRLSRIAKAASIDEALLLKIMKSIIKDWDPAVLVAALEEILGFLREDTELFEDAMQLLTKAATHHDWMIRKKTCTLIASGFERMPTMATFALKLLETNCQDANEDVRGVAIECFLKLFQLSDCVDDISHILSLGKNDPVEWIREKTMCLERQLTMTEEEKYNENFRRCLKEAIDSGNDKNLENLLHDERAIWKFIELMPETVSTVVRSRRCSMPNTVTHVVKELTKHASASEESHNFTKEAFRSLVEILKEKPIDPKFEIYIIQLTSLKTLLELLWMSLIDKEQYYDHVVVRLMDVAVTITPFDDGKQVILAICKDSEEIQYTISSAEAKRRVCILKAFFNRLGPDFVKLLLHSQTAEK